MTSIYVSNLFDMPTHVRELGVTHLVSVVQPEFQPDRPPEIERRRHHRVQIHDISVALDGGILAAERDVEDLVDFLAAWSAATPLLVHCYAGVSRSTAVALVAHVMRSGDVESSARLLRRRAPHALPNRRIIALADAVLGLGGALGRAVERMGPPRVSVVEAPLTALPLGGG